MEKYLILAFNLIVLIFVAICVITGLIRGLRKTASRGIFLILTAVIALFLTIPITNLLLKIRIDTALTIEDSTLSGVNSIEQILTFVIEGFIGKDFITNNPDFTSAILSIPLMFINTIVYVLLFWILKYLLLPLNYLFYRLTFAPKKKKENLAFSSFNNNDNNYDLFSQQSSNTEEQTLKDNNGNTHDKPFEFDQPQEESKPVDNSVFQPDNYNNLLNSDEDGLFIKKDPVEEKKQTPIIDIREEKPKKKKKEKVKVKKHRLLGGLIGGIIGLFIMSNTLLPVYGFVSILDEASKLKLEKVSDTEITLSNQTNGITDEILNSYNSSVLKYVSKYTGLEGLALAEFDYVTTKTIGDNKISLREDVKSLVTTAQKIDHLFGTYNDFTGDGNLSSLDKGQITILLNNIKDLLNSLKNIKVVDTLSDYIIPVTCSIILNSETELSNNENINLMIKDLMTSLNSAEDIDLFEEITSIIDLAEYLNNKDVLTKILKNDLSDPVSIINSLDEDFSKKLFSLKTLDVAIPHVLNITLTMLDDSLEFGYVKNDNTAETVKNAMSNFIDKTLELAKTFDTESSTLITYDTLIPLGKTLQVAKTSGLLNEDSYTNLINFAEIKLKDLLTDIFPDEFKDYILNESINNLSKVDNWEYEMSTINNAIIKLRNIDNGILGDVVEGEHLRHGTNIHIHIKEEVLINLGEALDILEETCIFGTSTTKNEHQISGTASLMLSILDYAKTTISNENNEDLKKATQVLTEMQTNIINSNHTYSKQNPFWKNELTYISPLFVNVYNMLDTNNFTLDSTLGKYLDKAKSSTMLGNGTTLTLMSVALDIVKNDILPDDYKYNNGTNTSNPQDINDKIYELFDSINTNLKTNAVKEEVRTNSKFWEEEIEYYISLNEIANKANNITTISDAVALAEDLDNVYHSFTIPRQQINNIIAFAIRDTKYKNLTSADLVKLSINNTIENIALKLEDEEFLDGKTIENFWTIEFDHIKSVTDIDFNDNNIKSKLTEIGNILDVVSFGNDIVRSSYLINHQDLRNILGNAITEMSSTLMSAFDNDIKSIISTSLNSIKDNILDTTNIPSISFEEELTYLKTLSELQISKDILTFPTGTDEQIQTELENHRTTLEKLGTQLDSISFNYAYNSSKFEYTENNSKIITRNIINQLIIDVFNLAKVDGSETTDIAFNNLITSIQSEISTHNTKDSIISWKRELGYVNSLVELNKDTTFTISNVSEELGKNIDAIAFNQIGNFFNDIKFTDNICTHIPTENGNSLFITRVALKTTLSSFLSTVKYLIDPTEDQLEIEKKEIVNDIIDNVTNICETNYQLANTTLYKNMENALNDLSEIDTSITTTIDGIDGDIIALKQNDKVSTVDSMLNTFELKPACGVLITRRIALLILKNIEIPSQLASTITYYNKLITHYEENIDSNSTESEYYETEEGLNTSTTHNPFDTLLSTVTI